MENLELKIEEIFIEYQNDIYTNTRFVADIFNRRHKNIIRALRNLNMPNLMYEKYFIENKYKDSRGRIQIEYLLSMEGFFVLTGNFTGNKARPLKTNIFLKFIELKENLIKNKELKEFVTF